MFYDRAAQENGLRLQKLPWREERWNKGPLSSLESLMPVFSLGRGVGDGLWEGVYWEDTST